MDICLPNYSDEQLLQELQEIYSINPEELNETERDDAKRWLDHVNEEIKRRDEEPLEMLYVERDDLMLQINMLKMSLRKDTDKYDSQTIYSDGRYTQLAEQFERVDRIINIREKGVCPCGMDNPVLAFGMCEDCVWEKDKVRRERLRKIPNEARSKSYPIQIV